MIRYFFLSICCFGLVIPVESQEQNPQALLAEGIYQEEVNGELDEAIKTYRSIVDQYPDNRKVSAEALLHLGSCYEKMDSPEAYQTYQEVINKYTDQKDEVAFALARVEYLDEYAADIREKAERHVNEGNELYKVWEYESAIKEYKYALDLDPNSSTAQNAQYYMGQSYFKVGQYDKALATFKNIIEENPESAIVPVTELMITQVQHAMNDNKNARARNNSDENIIVDPETGITFKKIKTLTGKSDVIKWTSGIQLSPNGRFLLKNNTIIPMDGSEPFNFNDMNVDISRWSPDGGKIAFTNGDSSIFVINVSPESGRPTEPAQKLLSRDCKIYGINWSPDGQKLFFSMISYNQKDYPEIYSLSISDGSIRVISNESVPVILPSCSPDGNSLAFIKMHDEIWLSSTKGWNSSKLSDNQKTRHTAPNWTPDGKWLFSDEARKGWGRSLNFIHLSGKQELEFKPLAEVGSYLSFSPDGDKIYLYRPSYNIHWGMKVASSSGGPSYEPMAHLPVYGAQWSTDSKMIIVQGEKNNKIEEGDAAIRVVPISGGESFLLDLNIDVDGKPFAYNASPDNKHLLFKITKEDEKEDLYIIPISVREAKIIGPPTRIIENWARQGAYNTQMSWSADGSKLAFNHNKDIWIYYVKSKELIQITETPENKKRWIAWSLDGTMLSYQEIIDKPEYKQGSRIISAIDGKTIRKIDDFLLWPYGWSPDSKSFVYEQDGVIVNHNIITNEVSIIIDLKSYCLQWNGRFIWLPDGKHLIIDGGKELEPDKYYLYKITLTGDELTEIASGDSSFKYDLTCSPDGKWISYCFYEMEKVRPEGTMWAADFEEILEKLKP